MDILKPCKCLRFICSWNIVLTRDGCKLVYSNQITHTGFNLHTMNKINNGQVRVGIATLRVPDK